jgi:hypothetical protein
MSHLKDTCFRTTPFADVPRRDNAVLLTVPILFSIGLLLLARRVAGALESPLPTVLLLITATLLVAWSVVINDHWLEPPGTSNRGHNLRGQIFVAAAWTTLVLFAIACSFPFDRLIDWLLWPAAFAAAWFGPQAVQFLRERSPRLNLPLRKSPTTSSAGDHPDAIPVQRITRYRSPDGVESIHARLSAEVPRGERSANVHVAFCPPFERLPTVEAYLTDDISAEVNLTQVLHHGAQIEIRLPTPAHARTPVNVELMAVETVAAAAHFVANS